MSSSTAERVRLAAAFEMRNLNDKSNNRQTTNNLFSFGFLFLRWKKLFELKFDDDHTLRIVVVFETIVKRFELRRKKEGWS